MIYEFIDSQKAEFNISFLCNSCNVSRQSYYSWLNSREAIQDRLAKDLELKDQILQIYRQSKSTYGAPKITYKLRQQGIHISRKKVAKLMVDLGIKGACSRKKIRTTIADKKAKFSLDLLKRNFSASEIDKVFVSDLTYIETLEGWLYLVAILDVYTRKIVGYSMGTTMDVELFTRALKQLQYSRNKLIFKDAIFHSDHGSQYTSAVFRQALKLMGMKQSMGTVGDSYDNALAENLWSLIKRETYTKNMTIEEARLEIFSWINWYNNERIHGSLNYLTPQEFEELELEKAM